MFSDNIHGWLYFTLKQAFRVAHCLLHILETVSGYLHVIDPKRLSKYVLRLYARGSHTNFICFVLMLICIYLTVADLQVDDMDAIVIYNNTLYTPSTTFNVSGNVSLEAPVDNKNRRTIGALSVAISILFHGLGHLHHTNVHHHGHLGNVGSVLYNIWNGFTFGCNFRHGHMHDSSIPWYLFTTHDHHYYNHGTSLHFVDDNLHFHVKLGHKHFYLKVHFHPKRNHYHISCSFRYVYKKKSALRYVYKKCI